MKSDPEMPTYRIDYPVKRYVLIEQYENSDAELGEVVELSIYGEYCPEQSLRGYKRNEIEHNSCWMQIKDRISQHYFHSTSEVITFLWGKNPQRWRIFKEGKEIEFNEGDLGRLAQLL